MLGEHYVWGKEIYFDKSFHLPLVIRDPRPAAKGGRGKMIDAMSEAVDIMPTILECIGLEVPRTCDGASLVPFLHGKTPAHWRKEVFFEHDFREVRSQKVEKALGVSSDEACYAVIRDKRYKYVHFAALPPLFFDRATPMKCQPRGEAGNGQTFCWVHKMLTWRWSDGPTMTMHVGRADCSEAMMASQNCSAIRLR